MTWLTGTDYLSLPQMSTDMLRLLYSQSGFFLIHDLSLGLLQVTRRVPVEGQELLTLPEHLSSPLDFSGLCVAQSLVLCVVFCRSLSFLTWEHTFLKSYKHKWILAMPQTFLLLWVWTRNQSTHFNEKTKKAYPTVVVCNS